MKLKKRKSTDAAKQQMAEKRITFYLSKDVQEKIKEEAKKENRSMSNYMETLLKKVYKL